ncbi:hypothetical protein [Dyella sp. S184]|uniref:hypothetical protein n=1 Tax=Dyella sp. S184 TaxID=1641862 RepID=UPI00131ECC20|nr:hypothetical protein [Dyella sp. S184]
MPASTPSATYNAIRRGLLATALMLLGDALLTGCQAVLFSGINAPQPCAATTLWR